MPFFVVIRKPIREGFFSENVKNPSKEELLNDLQSYPHIFLLSSLEEAKTVAEIFFHPPQKPRFGGSYGLVAEVSAIFIKKPEKLQVDCSALYNNWVDSQEMGSTRKAASGIYYPCILIAPKDVESILSSHIPRNAKAYNANLHDTDFAGADHKCSIL